MQVPTKTIVVAPFWHRHDNVGRPRVERLVRWLSSSGSSVVVVSAGECDEAVPQPWGIDVAVADPLRVYTRPRSAAVGRRRASVLLAAAKWLGNIVLVPDALACWAYRVSRSRLVDEHGRGAQWVISSSPPESSHVAAARLARKLGATYSVDLRDGWTDEPLRPLLQRSRWRLALERRLEQRLLEGARHVFVTSSHWRQLLVRRFPLFGDKTVVLSNTYPDTATIGRASTTPRQSGPLRLLHAGRFSGSSNRRDPGLLLEALVAGARQRRVEGVVRLMGMLELADRRMVERWLEPLRRSGWEIEMIEPVARDCMAQVLGRHDGLLLLSISDCALPSKLVEYLAARRPILAVTLRDSAVWEVCQTLPQVTVVDAARLQEAGPQVRKFIDRCIDGEYKVELPQEFSDDVQRERFLERAQEVA